MDRSVRVLLPSRSCPVPRKEAQRRLAAAIIVYRRPSSYWYAQARDASTGAQIVDASGYSREDVLRALRGKFAMIGVTIKSITDEDPYVAGHYATKKKSAVQLQREINMALEASAMTPEQRAPARRTPRKPSKHDPEYLRKTHVAGELAANAWRLGGLDQMEAELKWLRRNDADPVIVGEFERLYHQMLKRELPAQR